MASNVKKRIRGEYLEMPGLRLTLRQAERLCGVDPTTCKQVFDALTEEKFLSVKPDGTYVRVTDLERRYPFRESA